MVPLNIELSIKVKSLEAEKKAAEKSFAKFRSNRPNDPDVAAYRQVTNKATDPHPVAT